MPDPIVGQMALSATSDIGNNNLQALQAHYQTKKSQKWSEKMYEKQYQDNIKFWNMQNEYNNPKSQMDRYKAAGLNPNLIYGQGNSGNASPINTPDVQPVQFRSPDVSNTNLLTTLNAFADLDIKNAQADNLRAQNNVIQQDAILRMAQIDATRTGAERSRFDLDFESELRPFSAEARRESVRQLRTSTDLSLNRDAREAASNSSYLAEAAERMLSMQDARKTSRVQRDQMRATIDNLNKEGTLKQLDIELKRNGINPNDPMWARVVGRILTNLVDKADQTSSGSIWNFLFK